MRCKAKINRREFLKKSVAAAGAVAFPYVISSSVLGKTEDTAPSNRITLGFIGLGWKGFEGIWGSLLQTFIADSNCQVLVVCDVDSRYRLRAKNFVDETYGNRDCAAYSDFREILIRDDIDAVVIATPDHWHAIQTIMACRHGKDVYCEKPLSLTVKEARAMVSAARRYDRVVQTGSQGRSNARLRYGCQIVRNGYIGEILRVEVSAGEPSLPCELPAEPIPDYLDWNMWLGPAPWRPYHNLIHPIHFRRWIDYSGGNMTDVGAHHFDLAQWGLGMDHWGPIEVLPPDSKNCKYLTYKYANGVLMYEKPSDGVTFVGTEGKVYLSGMSGESKYEPEELGKNSVGKIEKIGDLYSNKSHYDNFIDCIRSRKRPVADVEIGCRSVTVCHIGNIGCRLNRPLKWNPEKEEFIGDDEANRMLSRAYREPWQL